MQTCFSFLISNPFDPSNIRGAVEKNILRYRHWHGKMYMLEREKSEEESLLRQHPFAWRGKLHL